MSSKALLSRATGLAVALLGAGVLLAPCPASAQGWYGRGPAFFEEAPLLPPRAVVYRLRDRGFTEITRPLFDGRGYRLEATDPAGQRVRLFVDAGDGAVLGRQRLDPYFPSNRPVRTAPGYGWTEDEAGPRGRAAERLVPPADIPDAGRYPAPRPSAAAPRAPRLEAAPSADANALGLNPDARGPGLRPAEAPARRTAKLAPPARPAAPRTAPVAPDPKLTVPDESGRDGATGDAAKAAPDTTPPVDRSPAGETAARAIPANAAPDTAARSVPDAKPAPAAQTAPAAEPATAAVAPPKESAPEPVRAPEPAAPTPAAPTPAAVQPPAAETGAGAPKTASAAPNWQNPPASEPARKVRVIGGATVVPRGEGAPQGGN